MSKTELRYFSVLVFISSLLSSSDLIGRSLFSETQYGTDDGSDITINVLTSDPWQPWETMVITHDYHSAKWAREQVIAECCAPFLAYRSMPMVNKHREFCLSRVSWQSLETFQFAGVGKGCVYWHPWLHTEAKDDAKSSHSAQDKHITKSYPTLGICDGKVGIQLPIAAKTRLVVPWKTFSPLLLTK